MFIGEALGRASWHPEWLTAEPHALSVDDVVFHCRLLRASFVCGLGRLRELDRITRQSRLNHGDRYGAVVLMFEQPEAEDLEM
jgi:hypothetical protein